MEPNYVRPFGTVLAMNILEQRLRIKQNKASLIVIDGGLGSGKTTLAVEIGDYFQREPINLVQQLAMGGEDFTTKLRVCIQNGYKVLIYDEAGDFSKKSVMSTFNKNLTRIFDTFRTYQMLIMLVLPNATKLDGHILDTKVARILVHCEERKKHFGVYKIFSLSDFYWILYRLKKSAIKPQAYMYQKPVAQEKFVALSDDRQAEMDKLSKLSKLGILDATILKQTGYVGVTEIQQKTGYDKITVTDVLRSMGFKPQKRIGKEVYFEEAARDAIVMRMKRKGLEQGQVWKTKKVESSET